MIVLSASNLTKVYGTDVILEGADFHVNNGDRIGLVGRNGAGKTTLLNMITGELTPDDGQVFVPADLKIGYLKQRDNFKSDDTVIEAINRIFEPLQKLEEEIARAADMIAQNPHDESLINRLDQLNQRYERQGGYTYKSEVTGILNSMAFNEDFYDKKIDTLSGGERTRLALAALLVFCCGCAAEEAEESCPYLFPMEEGFTLETMLTQEGLMDSELKMDTPENGRSFDL